MTLFALVPVLLARRHREMFSLPLKIITFLLIPVLALVLYWHLGNAQALFHYWALKRQAQSVKLALAKIKSPQQIVHQLQTYLTKHPNSPKGWYLLGKLYYAQHDFKPAVFALQKAYDQAPDHLAYAVSLAEADFFYRDRHLSPETKKIMLTVIQKERNNVGALNLLAINAYLQGQYRLAVQYWERLLPLFPVESRDQQILFSMIANAQKKEK